MKNKRIIKFLTAIISITVVFKSSGQIFATTTNTKQTTKQEEKKEPKMQEEEKEILKNNIKTFKNFKKENYEDINFNLTVYFKNSAPILMFEHKKNKAKIVVIPKDTVVKKDKENFFKNTFSFNLFVPNEKGLPNFAEKAIKSSFERKDFNEDGKYFNLRPRIDLQKNNPMLSLSCFSGRENEEELLKELLLVLKSPKMLKDEKVFNLEKKRILNERNYEEEVLTNEKEAFCSLLGKSEEIKKVTKKEFEEFFKNRVHPSNLLIVKHCTLENPLKIKKFLNLLNEEYLKYYEFKNIKTTPYTSQKEIFNIFPKKHTEFAEKYDFSAAVKFFDYSDEEDKKLVKNNPLIISYEDDKTLQNELKKFVEDLGYSKIFINLGPFNFQIAGNNKALFEKNTLRKNCRKIYVFLLEKLKNYTEKDIEKNLFGEELNENCYSANPTNFEFNNKLDSVIIENFKLFKDPFSKNCFEISENNEIKDSKEILLNKIKKSLNNLNKLKNKKEIEIDLYSTEKKEEKQKEILFNYIPIKITNNNGDYSLEILAKNFLVSHCLNEKLQEKALITSSPYPAHFLGKYIGFTSLTSTKEMLKEELKFYENEFEDFIKNYNITKKDFEKVKKQVKDTIKNLEKIKEYKQNILKKFEELLKKDAPPNNTINSFEENVNKTDIHGIHTIVQFENFEEYLKNMKETTKFNLKYVKPYEKIKDFKITKEYIKNYYEHIIKPYIKLLEHTYEILKKLKNNIDNISFKDFVNCVKSAKLVGKEEYEKDQKETSKLLNKILTFKN